MNRLPAVMFVFACALVACGDNHHGNPIDASTPDGGIDAPVDAAIDAPVDAPIDAPPDAMPPPPMITCAYTEGSDGSNGSADLNDDNLGGEELTGLTFNGSAMSICGVFNTGSAHYNATYGSIDNDSYGITVGSDADVLVTVTAAPSVVPAMGAVSSVEVYAFSDQLGETVVDSFWAPGGDHAVTSLHLTMGTWRIAVQASDNADSPDVTGSDLPYAITITPDDPSTRCMQLTGTASYVEAHDGSDNHANDTVGFDFDTGEALALGSGSDTPEQTGLQLAPGSNYLINGTSALVSTITDETYYDMDTYVFVPGSDANQISVRLDWDDATVPLDYYLFKATNLGFDSAYIQQVDFDLTSSDVFATAAVTPELSYWLSVGEPYVNDDIAKPYSITVCTEHFTPPGN